MKQARVVASPLRRRDHLREYLIACVRDGDLSWSDLINPVELADKLLSLFRKDLTIVLTDIGRAGGARLLDASAAMLSGIAETLGSRSKKNRRG